MASHFSECCGKRVLRWVTSRYFTEYLQHGQWTQVTNGWTAYCWHTAHKALIPSHKDTMKLWSLKTGCWRGTAVTAQVWVSEAEVALLRGEAGPRSRLSLVTLSPGAGADTRDQLTAAGEGGSTATIVSVRVWNNNNNLTVTWRRRCVRRWSEHCDQVPRPWTLAVRRAGAELGWWRHGRVRQLRGGGGGTDILSPVALSACYMGLVWVRDKLKSIASTKVVTHLLPLHAWRHAHVMDLNPI